MKNTLNKSGFTLIEIIVVLIIVGILAAIALPNLFNNIERSRANEAITNVSAFRQQVDACITTAAGVSTNCGTNIITLPTQASNFTYTIVGIGAAGGATIAGQSNRAGAVGTVSLVRNSTTGAWTCGGTGVYQGVCQ